MTYGWILATPERKWLAAANVPSMGRGSSLRAKGDGMLFTTLFASIVAHEYSSERQCKEHLEFEVPYPNTTLRAEYNIIEQIYQINKLHEITALFHWIQDHQDRNKDIDKLPIEAQLNIGADALANER